jgi:hypothetical protein
MSQARVFCEILGDRDQPKQPLYEGMAPSQHPTSEVSALPASGHGTHVHSSIQKNPPNVGARNQRAGTSEAACHLVNSVVQECSGQRRMAQKEHQRYVTSLREHHQGF